MNYSFYQIAATRLLPWLSAPLPAGKGSPGQGGWSYRPISTPFIHRYHLKQALASRNLCAHSTLQPLSLPGTPSPLHQHLETHTSLQNQNSSDLICTGSSEANCKREADSEELVRVTGRPRAGRACRGRPYQVSSGQV